MIVEIYELRLFLNGFTTKSQTFERLGVKPTRHWCECVRNDICVLRPKRRRLYILKTNRGREELKRRKRLTIKTSIDLPVYIGLLFQDLVKSTDFTCALGKTVFREFKSLKEIQEFTVCRHYKETSARNLDYLACDLRVQSRRNQERCRKVI